MPGSEGEVRDYFGEMLAKPVPLPPELMLNRFLRSVARLFYRLAGWRIEGYYPGEFPAMILLAPHTSNWDFVYWLAGSFALGVRGQWLGKHTIFSVPIWGAFLRAVGGVPVDRRQRRNFVEAAINGYREGRLHLLVLAPEGTRHRRDHWKSGFYHIALGAGVPVYLAFADYKRKSAGIGPRVVLSGDPEKDMGNIAAFYSQIVPLYPEYRSEPRILLDQQKVKEAGQA